MKTLSISISENEFNKFGLKSSKISFEEFLELLNKKLVRENLQKTIELSEKYGLSKMSMEDISAEVKAVRNAKNHH